MENTDFYEESLMLHARSNGKLEITGKVSVTTKKELSVVYTPGVAEPCLLIERYPEYAGKYTIKANSVAVVSDGSAVIGLGNIGGLAALPAVESKAFLYKKFGGIDAYPICLDTQDADEIVMTIKNIAPSFGGIILDGIAAPRCFEVERKLKRELSIPVFNDGGKGAAAAVGAAVINAYRLLGRPLYDIRAVVCGAGAAGNAVARMLIDIGVKDIVVCDSKGILSASRIPEFGEDKLELLELTNKENLAGGLSEAVKNRNLFIGVSKENTLSQEMIKTMAKDPVILALSNPLPEILPDLAISAGAKIVGTGRPDYQNQITSMLISPGLIRGTLDSVTSEITGEMILAAVYALSALVPKEKLSAAHILPSVFDDGIAETIANAVKKSRKK